LAYGLLLLVSIAVGESDSFENSLIGQFAVTSNDSIVYLDNRGGWHSIDMWVKASPFFVITTPLVRYDTAQSSYGGLQIVSDTAREVDKELAIISAFEIKPLQIRCIEDISIGDIKLNIPKCPKLMLLASIEASASIILLVDTLGNVTDAFILETNGVMLWNEIAFSAVKDNQFCPIMINVKPEKAWIIIPTGNHIERR